METMQIVIIALVVVFIGLLIFMLMKQYRKVSPNEVLIVSGGRKRVVTEPDGTKRTIGYRANIGGGTLVLPFFERAETLPIEVITVNIKISEVLTKEGIPLIAEGTAQVKIKNDDHSIRLAAEQFLGLGSDGIRDVAKTVLEGKMRSVIGSMTVEEIYMGREEFTSKVEKGTKEDFQVMGLTMISFALQEISDTQGYLDALAKPRIAQVKRDATIAQAEADKDAQIKASQAKKEGDIAKLRAEAEIAGVAWDNEAKKAQSQVHVNKIKAQADIAYEMERSIVTQSLKKEEYKIKVIDKEEAIKVEDLEIKRKEKELEANIKKPSDARKYQVIAESEAEAYRLEQEAKGQAKAKKLLSDAEAEKIKVEGSAEAEAMAKKAESYEKYNQAAVYQMVVDKLPELARSVSEPLSKIEKIIMIGSNDGNLGTSKITGQITNVLAQLPELIQTTTGIDLKKIIKDKFENKE
jgi:flotillin